ncbi:MAG: UDP-N-acetylmuramate--L-alanine ligase [Chlamydiota bacterium]|jgi:UDP-N-acetylmuramate--alanine ligase
MQYYFLGLGGIGMSALAKILHERNCKVAGFDQNKTELITSLEKQGVSFLPELPAKESTVIYSSAIPKDHPIFLEAKKRNYPLMHRSDLLSQLIQGKKSFLVAGTHGKTSTSALLSHVLISAQLNPSFAIGGILSNYTTNGKHGSGNIFVAEADESDGSFLKHPCDYAIVTNLEKEHLHYWKDFSQLQKGFLSFSNKAGKLFWCKDDKELQKLHLQGTSYGFSIDADIRACNLSSNEEGSYFDVHLQDKVYENIFLPLVGKHHVLNALVVFGVALSIFVEEKDIRNAFKSFKGVQRRSELLGEVKAVKYFTDYAHHPTEISATINSFKKQFSEKRLVVIFQPHRFSRTKDLFEQFINAFQKADVFILTDTYSAGEQDNGFSSKKLFENVAHKNKISVSEKDLTCALLKVIRPHDIILFLGAGSIDTIARTFFYQDATQVKQLKVGLIFGGSSLEHDVSCSSAKFFQENIDKSIYSLTNIKIEKDGKIHQRQIKDLRDLDICLPVLHGSRGEDGMIQGFLEALQIPFCGCDYNSSVVCMDKGWSKCIVQKNGVNTAPDLEITKEMWSNNRGFCLKKCYQFACFPLYVKGSHMGSSIGLKKCEKKEDIETAIDDILQMDSSLILEQEVCGRQIEFAVWGNEIIHVGVPAEILKEDFYSYKDKYEKNLTKVPAEISEKALAEGKQLAKLVYRSLKCSGLSRIDFFLTKEEKYIFNEINPMPGFTPLSAFFPMIKAKGISEKQFIDILIILGLQRARACQKT